ncbi:MAG TPA: tRNA 4-thiouridine(8) synthase ThiI [Candidatus Paceibacterota bacterium]|nr:tRNA 4-thiouridine(8) synthase ThiI [Candidatus Pacearchaeota archaeon]HRZ51359.1 tRNA 4-thiouridine(8) synthase ThiI [Candidatus Paceibacterota bacterium]HSA37081.1 tRNA 4-thiouridine(8) synthase ThiI [Candidatus Paceibacterota bacterium]
MERKKGKTARVILLMSGGLDSILAARILMEQGIKVSPLCFKSYFFCPDAAQKASDYLGLPLRVIDFSDDQLKIVKKPKFGRGAAINPCIDCHLLMLLKAREIMEKEGFDLIATGEVLEERPMSQNKKSLALIEKESGLAGKLLRPLSAKLLPATEAETSGLVNREKLEAISGRSRKRQLELADKLKIKEIPQPSGGCILCEKDYGDKLACALKINPDLDGNDVLALKSGRIFFEKQALVVVARDKAESEILPALAKAGDTVFSPGNFPGPAVLVRNLGKKLSEPDLEAIGRSYLAKYSKKTPKDPRIEIERR